MVGGAILILMLFRKLVDKSIHQTKTGDINVAAIISIISVIYVGRGGILLVIGSLVVERSAVDPDISATRLGRIKDAPSSFLDAFPVLGCH